MKFIKWFFIVFAITLALLFTLLYVFSEPLKKLLLHRLKVEIEATIGNYYHLEYENIEVDIASKKFSITLLQPKFTTDTTQQQFIEKYPPIFFKADTIIVSAIDIFNLYFQQSINIENVNLSNPNLTYFLVKNNTTNNNTPTTTSRKQITEVSLNQLKIYKGNISFISYQNKNDTVYYGEQIDVEVAQLYIPLKDTGNIIKTSSINNLIFTMKQVRFQPDESTYSYFMKQLHINLNNNIIEAENVNAIPKISLFNLSKNERYQKTFAKASIGKLSVKNIDFKKLIDGSINIKKMEVSDSKITLLRNKEKQFNLDDHKYTLQQNLKKLGYPLQIDTVVFKNIAIDFLLKFPKHEQVAAIPIRNISGTLLHVTNLKEAKQSITLKAKGSIFEEGNFLFQATFSPHQNNHRYNLKIQQMPFKPWNEVINKISPLQFEDGNIDYVLLTGNATEHETQGTITFAYHNLKVNVNKTDKEGNLKKSKIKTFVANKLVYESNPRNEGEQVQIDSFYFKREPYQGHAMLWVGGLIEGMETTLLKKKVKEKIDKMEANKKQNKVIEKPKNKEIRKEKRRNKRKNED